MFVCVFVCLFWAIGEVVLGFFVLVWFLGFVCYISTRISKDINLLCVSPGTLWSLRAQLETKQAKHRGYFSWERCFLCTLLWVEVTLIKGAPGLMSFLACLS